MIDAILNGAEYFGGCVVGGIWVPVETGELWDAAKVFFLSCITPPHPAGQVEQR